MTRNTSLHIILNSILLFLLLKNNSNFRGKILLLNLNDFIEIFLVFSNSNYKMGRKKSDSPTSFPWEKLFSESDNEFNQAISYCSSDHIGSDTVKKAVTTVVSGYNSGSKVALCDKIKTKANHIRQQILKTDNPEDIRTDVIEFYKNTFLKKFEGKVEGINNIVIPARPILPELSQEERKIYGSPPSSPRARPRVLDDEDIPEIDIGPLDEPEPASFDKLLEAQLIVYALTKAEKDGTIRSINAKEFYGMLKDTYEGTGAEEYMLNKDNVKSAISNLTIMLKANKNKIKGLSDAKKIISNSPFSKVLRPVAPPSPQRAPPVPQRAPPVPQRAPPVIEEEDVEEEPVRAAVRDGSITGEEIIEYIRKKGWSVPSSKSKEKLCDYVLTKLAKEDKKEDKRYEELLGKVEELTTNLFTLIEMHEERIKKLEKIKKKRKVSFAEKDEIRIIEEEKKEIEEEISEVKDKLEEATKEKEKIDTEKEVKKRMCFRMKKWLDEDDFDRVKAEQDLSCGNEGICNVDVGECELSVSSTEHLETIGSVSIKGSKDTVDKIKRKFEKKKVVIEDEEIIPEPKKKPLVIDDEEEEIPEPLVEEEPEEEEEPVVEEEEEIIIPQKKPLVIEGPRVLLDDEEEEIPEPAVEEEPVEEEDIPDIASDIELSEDEEEPVEEEPKAEEEKKEEEEVIRKCNTIPLDEDVDEETRAKDLYCGEGKVCNLDMSMCVVEDDLKEPAEEITIGGMLVKVVGSNAILNKLKEKIIKSGGEIPSEPQAEAEPVVEKEPLVEEEPAVDVFKANIPGVRPTLESIIQGIKSISRNTNIVSEQSKIKSANKKCLERIAKCAGINI